MCHTRMSTFGRLVLLALSLMGTSAGRVMAQVPDAATSHIDVEPSNPSNVSQTQPVAPAGDPSAGGAAGTSSTSTAPQPPPFGGPWNSRPKLTGDWWGLREQSPRQRLHLRHQRDHVLPGDCQWRAAGQFRFGGRDDYLVNVDGQKAGLWQGLGINLHGETVYGDSVNLVTGAIVPVNIGRAHPVFFGTETALTAVKFTQALSENFVLYAGKINTIDNIQQPFMPGRGLDAGFMNAAFVWNPILGRTMNYATIRCRGRHPGGRLPGVHANGVRHQQ